MRLWRSSALKGFTPTVFCLGLTLLVGGCSSDDSETRDLGPAGTLYVINQRDATLYTYDTRNLRRTDSVGTVIDKPHYLEFSPSGERFYLTTLETTGHIGAYDPLTNLLLDSIRVPPSVQPTAIAITKDGRYGYVCNFSLPGERTHIHKFDLATMEFLTSVQAGSVTHDVKITSDGSKIVACNMNSDDLTIVYPDADTVAFVNIDADSSYGVSMDPKYGPHGIVIDHADSLAYIACMMKHQVRVLDLAQMRVVDSIAIPIHHSQGHLVGPTLLVLSPDDHVGYVTTSGGNSMVAFDTRTKAILADITFETPYSFGITISNDGSRVYVACVGQPLDHGRIYIIDTDSLEKTDSLDVGRESFGVAWRPEH